MIDRSEFPQQVKLSARAIAWREADIDAWIEARQPAKAA
jgi:prophage regulatory protein